MDKHEPRGIALDGPEVRRRRKLKGLERGEFAELCGISAGYVSLLERNSRQPSPTVFVKICDALGVSEDERRELVLEAGAA